MATSLRPEEFSTTTRISLSRESDTNYFPNNKTETPDSTVKKEENVLKGESNIAVIKNTDNNETLNLDSDLDNKTNVILETDERTDGECETADNLDHSMSSVSGWYGKGCSRFRKKRKSSLINKRFKKDIDPA